MSEENVTSRTNTNEKTYLGVIVVLVLALIYLFFFGPKQERVVVVEPETPPESVAIKEGWGSFMNGGTFKDFVTKNNIKFIVAIDDKLQSYIGDERFAEVPICARQIGATGVGGECPKFHGIKLLRDTTLTFTLTEGSHIYCANRGGYIVCQ